jgi:hypothetical protein
MKGKKQMTNKQLDSYLEAIKLIAQNASSLETVINAIEQLQNRLKQ